MEHRWGRRVPIRVPVRLFAESGGCVLGEIQNISISGAFVRTVRPVPLWARLEVEALLPGSLGRDLERIAAHVTRRTTGGVGIEWCQLAPRLARAVLDNADPSAAGLARLEMPREVRLNIDF